MEVTGHLNVDTLSGSVLKKLDTFVKHISYTKLEFDNTINNYYTKAEAHNLSSPLQTYTTFFL